MSVEPSIAAQNLGVATAHLTSQFSVLIQQMNEQASMLRAEGATEDDPRVFALAIDYAFVDALVSAASKSFTDHWVVLRQRR